MNETWEDMIEEAVNLHYRAYPLIKGMQKVVENSKEPVHPEYKQQLVSLVQDIEHFLTRIEASMIEDEDGRRGIDIDDFETRKIH